MDVLCADKTGTLTNNELTVGAIRPMDGFDEAYLLSAANCASAEGGQDPVDIAIRSASAKVVAAEFSWSPSRRLMSQTMSEASVVDASGQTLRVVKGAFATVSALAGDSLKAQRRRVIWKPRDCV